MSVVEKALQQIDQSNGKEQSDRARLRQEAVKLVLADAVGECSEGQQTIIEAVQNGVIARSEIEQLRSAALEVKGLLVETDHARQIVRDCAVGIQEASRLRAEYQQKVFDCIRSINVFEERRATAFEPHRRLEEIYRTNPEIRSYFASEPVTPIEVEEPGLTREERAAEAAIVWPETLEVKAELVANVLTKEDQKPGQMREPKEIYPGWIG